MYRSHNCGELRIEHVGQDVKLSGWVHKIRDKGSLLWIDLRAVSYTHLTLPTTPYV